MAEYALALESGIPINQDAFLNRHKKIRFELQTLIQDINSLNQLGHRFQSQLGQWEPSPVTEAGEAFGDYLILGPLGSGGAAWVYEATQESLGRRVALKLFTGVSRLQPEVQKKFTQEARITASLPHDHIVPVYATGCVKGIPFIAMRLMQGGSTLSISGNLSPRKVATIGLQTAQALSYAHSRGILHRDIKPANILLDENGRAHLADFGLAMITSSSGPISSAGTLAYLAPEQIINPDFPPDPKGDIYSLGVSLYELATGKNPFTIQEDAPLAPRITLGKYPPLKSIAPDFPEDLDQIIQKAMSLLKEDRYSTADAFADDLKAFLAGEPVKARPLSRSKKIKRWLWSNRRLVATGMSSAILALLIGLGWIIRQELIFRAQEKVLLEKALAEQKLSATAAAKTAESARKFRHMPGMDDQERLVLAEFHERIQETCRLLGPEHPLRAEEALILHQLWKLEQRTGSPEKSREYVKAAIRNLREVAHAQSDRADILGHLADAIHYEADEWIHHDLSRSLAINDEALEWTEKALLLRPDSGTLRDRKIWIQMYRMNLFLKMGQLDKARETGRLALSECQGLIDEFPTGHPLSYIRPALVWDILAQGEIKLGTPIAAEHAYDQALFYETKTRELFGEQAHLQEVLGRIGLEYAFFLISLDKMGKASRVISERKKAILEFCTQFQNSPGAAFLKEKIECLEFYFFEK